MKYNKYNLILLFSFFLTGTTRAQCIQGNCTSGLGTYIYPSGAKYTGYFVNNKIHGKGSLFLSNGDIYSGDWKENYKDGNGRLQFGNGDIYLGEFRKSKIEGKGIMTFAQGGKYEGEWKNNLPHGKGKYQYANGEIYDGLLYSGQRHGAGRYFYQDGSSYDGQWAENQRNGNGILLDSDHKKISGIWKDDVMINENKLSSVEPAALASNPVENQNGADPTAHLIDCNKSRCDGVQGIYVYKDGSKYVGPFKNGNPYGKGILYYSNGDRYEGDWDDIAPNGNGIMYFSNGRVYAAVWDRGRPVKQLDNRVSLPSRNDIKVYQDDEIRIWPVVIGVAQYAHMPVLKYADDDAYRIFAFLKSPEGGAVPDNQIKILVDEDATRQNIIDAIQEQFGKADENDMVMIYYSGHGISGSLLPIDFDGYNNKLYHDEIIQIMESSKAKHKLCLVDACYAGSMQEAKADFTTSINKFYSVLNQERGGTAMILSCKEREVSLEDSGLRQGIFSHYLMKGLKGQADANGNKIVTVQELYDFIKNQVGLYTGNVQNPIIEGSYNPKMPVAWIRN